MNFKSSLVSPESTRGYWEERWVPSQPQDPPLNDRGFMIGWFYQPDCLYDFFDLIFV
jgi:hypothetical protein